MTEEILDFKFKWLKSADFNFITCGKKKIISSVCFYSFSLSFLFKSKQEKLSLPDKKEDNFK